MRISKIFFAAVASMALFNSPVHGQPQRGDLQSAQALLGEGHPDRALALVDPIIAQAMLEEAKDPAAFCPSVIAAVFQSLMKDENDWCDAMLLKGYALNELKRPAEAELVLKTLVGHAPNNAHYILEYAYTVRVNGDLERSLDLYRRAEKVASELSDKKSAARWRAAALRGQGYAYIELQRWDDATNAYQRSIKYDPDSEIARSELRYIEENRLR